MDSLGRSGRVVVVDTETTGLSNADRVVEFAALEVDARTGAVGRRLHQVIDPQVPIPAVVTRIHGISNADVLGKPAFSDVAETLARFLRGATIVAQNAPFDTRLLNIEFARAGRPPLDAFVGGVIDAMRLSRGLFPLLPRHKLDDLCDRLGVDRSRRHRHGALLDAELLASTLPRFARAYDAWCTEGDEQTSAATARVVRSVVQVRDDAVRGAETSETSAADDAEVADGAFPRIVAAAAVLQQAAGESVSRLEREIAEAGWCSKRFAARWTTSASVSWKDAARAHLTDEALASFAAESRCTSVNAGPCDERFSARLDVLHADVVSAVHIAEPHEAAALLIALLDAARDLDGVRERLRTVILDGVSRGYRPQRVAVRAVSRTCIDYRSAVKTLIGDIDTSPFRSQRRALKVHARDLSACEALFGPTGAPMGAGSLIRRVA